MENEIAARFFMSKLSTVAAVENFIQQFIDLCDETDALEQALLIRNIQQLFRRYYYSSLMPESSVSPALIASTLTEREFSRDAIIIPTLKVDMRGKQLKKIVAGAVSYDFVSHPFLEDLEQYADWTGREVVEIDESGLLSDTKKAGFLNDILINDRHYLHTLCMIALEAGLVVRSRSEARTVAKPAGFLGEFVRMEGKKKLEHIIGAVLTLCSRMISKSIPNAAELFTVENLHGILINPGSFNKFMESVLLSSGLRPKSIQMLAQKVLDNKDSYSLTEEEVEYADRVFQIQVLMDMYFFTPLGFYLQLLQPLYWEVFDMIEEVDKILESRDDFSNAGKALFLIPESYNLTPLGEAYLTEKTKPGRLFTLPKNVSDRELQDIVEKNEEYILSLYSEETDSEETDYDSDYEKGLQHAEEEYYEEKKVAAKAASIQRYHGPKITKIISNPQMDGRVFVFKVKDCDRKSQWCEIQLYGSNTLDDLHESIGDSFELGQGQPYSFFMRSKVWDRDTKYSHPQGDGQSAKKIRISGLDLQTKQKFLYLHDSGSVGGFEVELTAIQDAAPGVRYPLETRRSKKN